MSDHTTRVLDGACDNAATDQGCHHVTSEEGGRVSESIPRTVAEMTALQQQVFRTVIVWGQLGADARNDKPWSEMRHGKYLADELNKLAAFCGYALDEDEYEKLWPEDVE